MCGRLKLDNGIKKRAGDPVSLNRLLVEDLTAVGYPRPAPLLAASDHVFFVDRTAGATKRSVLINLFSCPDLSGIQCPSFRDAPVGADPESSAMHWLWIPGSRLRLAPE
jgi:hypothetical protein